jgi:hypothetical protein
MPMMKWIRGHKFYGTHAICAVLLSALIFSFLYPCHEYIGYSTGSITLGYDICDDSPCLTAKAKYQGVMPIDSMDFPNTESAVLWIFAHLIFHPPKA